MKEKQYKKNIEDYPSSFKTRRKEGKLRIHAKFKPVILHSAYFMKYLNEGRVIMPFRGVGEEIKDR